MGSVFFYSIQAVVAKGFYTLEKGSYFMKIGLLSIVLNIVSNFFFARWMGPAGLALSASLVGMIYSILTFTTLNKISGGLNIKYIAREFLKIAVATLAMSVVLFAFKTTGFLGISSDWTLLLFMIPLGALLYFLILWLCKSKTFTEYFIVIQLLSLKKK